MEEDKLLKEETAKDFSDRLNRMYSDCFAMMSLALGSDLGLIDKILSYDEPKTCKEIADDSSLKERYVQEWLGVMTTGKIVDLHQTSKGNKFLIPLHRRNTLSGSGHGMVLLALTVPFLMQVYSELKECMKNEGPSGIPYISYKGYHDWGFRGLQGRCDRFIGTLDEVPGLTESLGSGITLCDLGCSVGHITLQIAQKFPNSQIHGVDIGEDAIDTARKSAGDKSLSNCHFHAADISNMPADWTEKWDFIFMYDVLHNIPHTSRAFSEIYRTLKQGDYFSLIDVNLHTNVEDNIDNHEAPLLYAYSLFQCLPTSLYFEGNEGMGTRKGLVHGNGGWIQ